MEPITSVSLYYVAVPRSIIIVIEAPFVLMRKTKPFIWTIDCQETWDYIKQKYMEALILTPPNWQLEFHVHTCASLLAVGAMLA